MKKNQIIMLLLIASLSIGIISLYTTFAYDEEAAILNESKADYNLIYSIKTSSSKNVSLNANEEKFVDIILTNSYSATLKYGIYYKSIKDREISDIKINLTEDSISQLQSTIKPNETKTISLKLTNNSDNSIELVIGALVGFVQGNIEDLIKEGEILIK